MNISSFKLVNNGYSGVQVHAIEPARQGNMQILDNINLERKYPLPDHVREKVQDLKYFFLNLTGHWVEPYSKYIDKESYKVLYMPDDPKPPQGFFLMQSIVNKTRITGVTIKNAGFCIMGDIETVEGKKMGLTTPFVTEEDDVSFFIEAMDRIQVIMDELAKVLRSPEALPFNAAAVLHSIGVKSETENKLSEQEMIDMVIQKLQDQGAIILMSDDTGGNGNGGNVLTDGTSKATLHTGTRSIDSHTVDEAQINDESQNHDDSNDDSDVNVEKKEEVKEEVHETFTTTDKKVNIGTLAADKTFPKIEGNEVNNQELVNDASSLADYEYSHNMGIASDDDDVVPESTAGIEGSDIGEEQHKGNW